MPVQPAQKKLLLEKLWNAFHQKIAREWDEKYKSKFGEFREFNQIDPIFNFARTVHSDIIKHLTQKRQDLDEIISVHTLNQVLQKNSIPENSHHKTLDMLARYLDHQNWEDFVGLPDLLQEEENDHKATQKSTEQKGSQYFIYHYIDTSFKPDKSLLVVSGDEASLTTFHTEVSGKKSPNATFKGQVTRSEVGEVSIYFSTQIKNDTETPLVNPSFCSFSSFTSIREKLWVGVFAATWNTTSCGIIALEETSSEEYLEKIKGTSLPALIHSIIHNARLTPDYHHKADVLERKSRIIEKAKKYAGVYEGYSIVNESGNLAIQKLVFQIFDNADVRFKSYGKPDGESGRIVDVRKGSKNMVMQFSLNREHNYYKIQVIFDLMKKVRIELDDSGILIGIFGGIEETFENPMAGRIVLCPTQKSYEEFEVELIPVAKEEKIRQFFEENESIAHILKKFFRGELDQFVDPPYLLEKCPILSELPGDK